MITLYTPPIIQCGMGSIAAISAEAQRFSAKSAFLVTSTGMPGRPVFAALKASLAAAGVDVTTWAQVPAEPGTADLDAALGASAVQAPDIVVGLGGGSAMDIAKLVAILHTNPGPVHQYFGSDHVPLPGLPTIMVPTTSGSGSEVSREAVLTDRAAGTKFAVKDWKLTPASAIVDPQATATCPPTLTAISGLDALTHAIEAFTAQRANIVTDMYALQAVALMREHLTQCVANGDDLDARLGMALGALLAGLAFSVTGTAAVHACGYPLSGIYGIPHGAANALMLPYVVAFNEETCIKYAQIHTIFATSDLPATLRDLVQTVGLPTRLRDAGVERKAIPRLAAIAIADRRHLDANPRPVTVADLEIIFERAW